MKYVAISLLTYVATAISLAHAQVPHILGNWELNVEASLAASELPEEFSVPAIETERRTYLERDDGYLVGLSVTILNDGSINFLQFTAKTDGKEYPEHNIATLSDFQATGASTPMAYSERRVDEYTVEVTDKTDGNVTFVGTRSVSEDGNTMTIEWDAMGPDGDTIQWKLVYDRVLPVARRPVR
jgi:hypothetical protein